MPPEASQKDINAYDREFCLQLVHAMLRIRRLEEKCAELYGAGKIRGFLHLYIGEEAVATGVIANLQPADAVVGTYREHGHALLRGITMNAIMAEMFGKQEGCCKGRGGSMHLFDAKTRFYGGNAIVGGGLPIAAGLALADKLQGIKRVEGAIAEGVFHETMNLAVLWQLPVLFCCENNLYAMGTALDRSESQTDLCAKAASYKIPTGCADGMDVLRVYDTVQAAIAHVRGGLGPYFIELQTYRFRAHSMFDAELYRDKAEIEEWKKRGPIHTFTQRLKQAGMLTEEEFLALDRKVAEEVDAAVKFAEAGTWEPIENLTQDVYSPLSPLPLGEG
jgi:pyruvate dehydrogenase E1 component alpha subunit